MRLENILNYIVRSGSILAASSGAIVLANTIVFGAQIDFMIILLAFMLTFSSYHINRIAELEQDGISHPQRTTFIRKHRLLDFLAILAAAISLYIAFTRNINTFIFAILPPVVVMLYSFKILRVRRLKDILIIKNVIVAASWALGMFLTASYFELPFTPAVYAMAIFFFLRFFVNTIVFDIRDIVGDTMNRVKTIPIHFGELTTRNYLLIVNTISGLFLLVAISLGYLPFFAHLLNLITIYGYVYIFLSTDKKTDKHFLCDVIVDGEFLLWPILLIIGKMLFS